MACRLKADNSASVEARLGGLHFEGQERLGVRQVQRRQDMKGLLQGFRDLADGLGKASEDSVELLLFLDGELLGFVPKLHAGARLDENGRSAGAGVVDDSAESGAMLGFYRDTEAAFPNGNHRLLNVGRILLASDDGVQL